MGPSSKDSAAATLEADEAIVIARFRGLDDTGPRSKRTTWPELQRVLLRHLTVVTKSAAPLWSPVRYAHDGRRGNASVMEVTALVADLDDGTDAQTLGYWLERYDHLIVSTYSHTSEHPKLRAVVRLLEPIPVADYTETWRRANQHLFHGHLDPSTRDPARMYFVPSSPANADRVALAHEGAPLDWRTLPPVPAPRPLARVRLEGLPIDASDGHKRAHALLGKWSSDLAAMSPATGRHNTLLRLARAAGGLVASGLLHEAAVVEVLEAACESNGLRADDGDASVERTLRAGLEHGAGAPWVPDDLPDSPTWRQPPRARLELESSVPSSTPLLVGTELFDSNGAVVPSSKSSKNGLELNRLEGIDAALLREQEAPDEVPSLPLLGQDGYIVLGWSNLLAAYPRTGKTELLAACIPDWLTAGYRVLYFTEEPLSLWRLRLRRRAPWPPGCRIVAGLGIDPTALLAEMQAADEPIVIVDAIRNLLAFVDENDNSEVARKINPWVVAARAGDKTLELVHHLRKGAGEHGEGIAGGHALLGAVDIALEVLRDQHGIPNRRRIRAWARLVQPPELLYEQDAQHGLVALGDPSSLDQTALEGRVLDQLTDDAWATTQEAHAALGDPKPSQEGVRVALTGLAERGLVERDPPITVGRVRGKAHRWKLPSAEQFQVPLIGTSLGTELSDLSRAPEE